MSIVQVREAFTKAAGDKLHLDSLLMNYAEDRRAQQLTATGTLDSGAAFTATTAPFNGDVSVIMQRAEQLVAEILAPEAREQGTTIKFTADETTRNAEPAPPPEPEPEHKPKVAPKTHRR